MYSLAEISPEVHDGSVLLADSVNGKPLGDAGPIELICSGEKFPARWIRNVVSNQSGESRLIAESELNFSESTSGLCSQEKPLVWFRLLWAFLLVFRLFRRGLVLFLGLACLRRGVLVGSGALSLRMSNRSRMLLFHSLRLGTLYRRCLLVFGARNRCGALLLHGVLDRRRLPLGGGLCMLRGRLVLWSRLLS